MTENNEEGVNSPTEDIAAITTKEAKEVQDFSLQDSSAAAPELSYISGWQIYGLGWSYRPDKPYRLAIGSFIEGTMNRVQILHVDSSRGGIKVGSEYDDATNDRMNHDVIDDDDDVVDDDIMSSHSTTPTATTAATTHSSKKSMVSDGTDFNGINSEEIRLDFEFNLSYPTTKIMWIPDTTGAEIDLFATAGDFLRLWEVTEVEGGCSAVNMRHKLSFKKKDSDYCSPVTSFDWNKENLDFLGTASVDTTCTIWSVETQKILSQLIAHDKEVYDMAFASQGTDIFGSVGADGSLRLFDLRCLEHSAIVYESPDLVPLLKLAWNPKDPNFVAVLQLDSNRVAVVDIRNPAKPYAELTGHTHSVNDLAWAPNASNCLATCGEDKKVLVNINRNN